MSIVEILIENNTKKLFDKYLEDGLYHVTTDKAIKNNKLYHPEGEKLFFEFYYSEMMKEWSDEIIADYGGKPILIFIPKENVKKYNWEISTDDAESEYVYTKDKINLNDIKIKKL